jgi:Flp pilus assembly pilin Flp
MQRLFKKWLRDQQGEMAEKGVMLAILILAVLASLQLLGGKISDWFTTVAGAY